MIAVVTDVHYRMSFALLRDLEALGAEVYACEYADVPAPAGFASSCVSRCMTLPRSVDALYELCAAIRQERGEKPALFPVGAGTLAQVSAQRQRFAEVCGLLCPSPAQLELLNDKAQAASLACELGVPVPTLWESPAQAAFPAVVKPLCGEKQGLSAQQRYRIVRTPEELAEAVAHFTACTGQQPLMQQYLYGGGAGCSVLAKDGAVLAAVCHERLREYPVSGGPSSCCKWADHPELLAYVTKMVEKTRFSGVAMFEFKADAQGKYHFLEVNPRVWGTYPLTRVCGSNFAQLWLQASLGLPLSAFDPGREVTMVYYPSDFAAILGYLRRGQWKAALRGMGDFFDPRVKNGLRDSSDPRPYRVYLQSLLKG